jgi:alanine or glycine:cation symporter, AGCS family
MDATIELLNAINAYVWGPPMLVLILGTGLFLMLRLGGMPLLNLGRGFRLLWQARSKDPNQGGELSPFQALMTCLSATVGIGNIAGVATAIYIGGPGALFWMWCTALVGMATKYSEVVLAVHYRRQDARGEYIGGPMYAIREGLGPKFAILALAFALFGGLAGFGIGNMVQVNTMADALHSSFGIAPSTTGVVSMLLVGVVILGGVKRIGVAATALVPLMCVVYVLAALVVLVVFRDALGAALVRIVSEAFTGTAATGGFVGATWLLAMQYGVARGIFSNEAGLGTAGIAQAAGTSASPVQSGLIGMLGTFIDTLVVCTMTGLAIVASGVWTTGSKGASLSAAAFEAAMPGVGAPLLSLCLVVFAFTTILGWAYYGEKCWIYLAGPKTRWPFRAAWVAAVGVGATVKMEFVWVLADVLNGLMAIPNLIALLLLSGMVVKLTREYFLRQEK